jgi:hypothetical protein
MKGLVWIAAIMMLSLGTIDIAQAQWPLGRQLSQAAKVAEPGPHVTATGRFQVFISPHVKDQTFMIDTDTGKVWILKKDHTTGDFSLKRVPVEEVDQKAKPSSASKGDASTPPPSTGAK